MSRLPIPGADDGQWGKILNDYLSQAHDSEGDLKADSVGTSQIKASSVTPQQISGIGQANGLAPLDSDGKLTAVHLPDRLSQSTLSATFPARRVHVISADGQSNMAGRGRPINSAAGVGADAAHPRIFQYPSNGPRAYTFTPAVEPLTMHEGNATAMGPALQFARNWISELPEDDIIVIVPNAHGGTMLSTNVTPLGWRWGVSGNLSAQAVTLTQAALNAASAQWPAALVNLDVVLWFQGETDGTNATPPLTYQTDLDALIAGYRTAYQKPNLPFIILQMIPESLGLAARALIDQVHRNTPWRVAKTDIVLNSVTGHNQNNDGLHADAYAHRIIYGPGALDAYKRITSGRLPVNENPYGSADFGPTTGVTALTATNAHSIPISWNTLSGATSYRIDYQEPGSQTWVVAGTTNATTFTLGALAASTSYNVSVVAINGDGQDGLRSVTVSGTTASAANIATDTFNRTGSTLGNADTGQTWTALTGSFLTTGTQAYHGSTTNAIATLDGGIADGIVRITLNALASLERLVFRGNGTKENYWFVQQRSSANSYQLYKTVDGVYSQVGGNSTLTPATNDVIEASMTDSQISIRINGTLIFRINDTHQQTATHHGFGGSSSNTARFDDFSLVH